MQSELGFLIHVMNIPSQVSRLEMPDIFSFRLKKYGFSILHNILAGKIIKPLQVDVILDLDATLEENVSEDRKSMQQGRKRQNLPHYNLRRFHLCPCSLGSKRFNYGRHYWKVEVENKTKWALSVC